MSNKQQLKDSLEKLYYSKNIFEKMLYSIFSQKKVKKHFSVKKHNNKNTHFYPEFHEQKKAKDKLKILQAAFFVTFHTKLFQMELTFFL